MFLNTRRSQPWFPVHTSLFRDQQPTNTKKKCTFITSCFNELNQARSFVFLYDSVNTFLFCYIQTGILNGLRKSIKKIATVGFLNVVLDSVECKQNLIVRMIVNDDVSLQPSFYPLLIRVYNAGNRPTETWLTTLIRTRTSGLRSQRHHRKTAYLFGICQL